LDNELTARVPTAAATNLTVTVTGEVEPGASSNKWYNTWAFCRGVSARVNPEDGTFSLPGVPLYPGTNVLVVRVRDVSGNEAEQTRTVVRTNALETFEYDGKGNLANWVSGAQNWSYEWDWADRLTQVTSNGVAVLENWYDAQSRRIAKAEVVNGQMVKTLYLYDGWDIVGVMNEAGQMRETLARGIGLAGDIGTLVAVTHHPASWTNGTFYAHHNHRGDVILTRSGATTVGCYDYAAFGSLKSQTGPDVCRFKFSSKERDVSTGFSHYGYRFYAPQWQRWMSKDPIVESGGLNLYRFCANNPVCFVEAAGLFQLGLFLACLADIGVNFAIGSIPYFGWIFPELTYIQGIFYGDIGGPDWEYVVSAYLGCGEETTKGKITRTGKFITTKATRKWHKIFGILHKIWTAGTTLRDLKECYEKSRNCSGKQCE